ncbi:MAG TPA: OFA family MFS transporter [Mycobacteriales bacterium]|jgi:MFS family permease
MTALSMLDRRRTVARWTYNRWLIPPAALAVHLSIGQVYAFSVFKLPLVAHFHTRLTPIAIVFSLAMVMLGLSAAIAGTWIESVGPRKAMFVAALCWPGGFAVAAVGVATHQLWLVYLGYGVLGGIGLGIAYISPVSMLIRWFPDRPGLAAGLAIMGFGGGALVASPLSTALLDHFRNGHRNGIVETFLVLGAAYLVVMMLGAFAVRLPPEGWRPAGWTPRRRPRHLYAGGDVTAANAVRTPQFWLLWIALFCNVTAGIGILEQASPMIQDFFPGVGPEEAAGYVGVLSLCNMAGRIVWSSTSDLIGRKQTYLAYLGGGMLLYLLVAVAGTWSVALFVGLTGAILSFYGGGFATIPAYIRDLYGSLQVGAIHGRLLTAWSAAGVAGPLIINAVADSQRAAGRAGAQLYTLSLYIMVGVLAVGLLANLAVRPVSEWFHEPAQTVRPLIALEG